MTHGQAIRKAPVFQECLNCPACGEGPCEVERAVNHTLFVHGAHAFLCYHRTSFGNSYMCRCPVRKEIYRRYGQ